MKQYQQQFIELAIAAGALKFGEYTLKSGRVSPYFFNAGAIYTGAQLAVLADCYAAAIADAQIEFDMLFGPAYKGIPLAATTAVAYSHQMGMDVPYAYNRKETKQHGEGGHFVGAPVAGKVLVIDDVITAGTAIREVLVMIAHAQAEVCGVIIGLDRQERGQGELSAITELERAHGIKVYSIVRLEEIISFLQDDGAKANLINEVQLYRARYGVD